LQLGEFLQRISGGSISLHLDLSPDWRIFTYAAAVSVLTGVAVGLWPALKASRRDVVTALKQGSGGSVTVFKRRNLLLGAQVAACLVLLVTAGLMFRGVRQAGSVDPAEVEVAHTGLAGGAQLGQGELAELLAVAGQRVGGEKGLHLDAERLFLASTKRLLDAVPERIAGQGDFQGAPGGVGGSQQGLRQSLAVIAEAPAEEADDGLAGLHARGDTEDLAGAVDKLLQREAGQVLENRHGGWSSCRCDYTRDRDVGQEVHRLAACGL
jgi:hypothetical protein